MTSASRRLAGPTYSLANRVAEISCAVPACPRRHARKRRCTRRRKYCSAAPSWRRDRNEDVIGDGIRRDRMGRDARWHVLDELIVLGLDDPQRRPTVGQRIVPRGEVITVISRIEPDLVVADDLRKGADDFPIGDIDHCRHRGTSLPLTMKSAEALQPISACLSGPSVKPAGWQNFNRKGPDDRQGLGIDDGESAIFRVRPDLRHGDIEQAGLRRPLRLLQPIRRVREAYFL